MAERTIEGNGIEIWTEDFGNPSDPLILLIMGASGQGIMWREEMCQAFVDAGRYVIRYDNRDVGQSTCFDFAKDPYTVAEMALDAVAVLDAYGIERAHAVGASMGGMIGQTLAIDHPDRLHTLTSIMSSPGGGAVAQAITEGGAGDEVLPGPAPAVIEAMLQRAQSPPKTREEKIASKMELFRALAGSLGHVEDDQLRDTFTREYDRARVWEAQDNHGLAVQASPDRRPALANVTTPTLVIHGTEDTILPYEHGVATAKAIPGAELLTIEGMGHDFPEPAAERIIGKIIEHTSRA